jgi:hypothetical protein
MRATFLVHISSAEPRESQTDSRRGLTTMNLDEPDDLDDDDDDDDDDDVRKDEEDGGSDDDDEDGWEDEDDDEEPETWQVVDFPDGNCLDLRDFPAQPGWICFSRSRVATAFPPRRRP